MISAGLHSKRKLTLVSAPAGFGKTTLVAAWLMEIDTPAAWLSLDEADNDLPRFLAYLTAAFQQVDEDILLPLKITIEMKIPDHYMAFANREEWKAWLEEHHTTEGEAWLLIRRKGAARQFLMLEEAIEEALCFGWIDGALKPMDKESYAMRFSPRKPNSIWSVNNQRRVEKLIQEGRMTQAGLKKIAEAKENGEWEAAVAREDVSSVPDDLVQVLENNDAWIAFEKWPASQKKQYLYWLESAKRHTTREKRIQVIVEMAKRGQ